MSDSLNTLLAIMARLRDPERGCPWDLEQDFATIAPYTLEEAHEVADAIARGDMRNLEEELGDLLLQVVFHAQMASERNLFDFEAVARGIADKLIRRHPHVFPGGRLDGETVAIDSGQVSANWDSIKAAEKAARGEQPRRLLDGIGAGQPALARAEKLQKKAGKVGFDWNDPRAVIAKLREELNEVEAELDAGDKAAQEDELGDLLFCVVNLARHLDLDSEMALKRANAKFERRFGYIEDALSARGLQFADASLAEMEALWGDAKRQGL
ncbi:MAG: nucleoside triphosphate pyrophosphohydrolase [Moraxellaceae bacterium]|jgi:ATP diphosphatase|nr:nucleoside triphosphate pyrophosphohydrolase [Moraxellaceae bacterium]